MKSKPIYYKSLSHKRKLKITDPSEKNAKKKNKVGTIELINTSSENTQINPRREEETNTLNLVEELVDITGSINDSGVELNIDNTEELTIENVSTKKKDIYCICLASDEDGNFIGCHNKLNCKSFLKRKTELGVDGGDWFHAEC